MSKETTTTTAETAQKHYEVDVQNVKPLERAEGNIRKDMGDLDDLAKSIEQNGILNPIRAYKDKDNEGKWFAIDGHRRLAAAMKLVTEKNMSVRVKVISVDARKITDEELIFDMITTNTGKPLTCVEEAEAVRRLIAIGIDKKVIASRFGKPAGYINNLVLLAAAPQKIKKMLTDDRISYSMVMHVLKRTKDFDEAVQVIEDMFKGASKPHKNPDAPAADFDGEGKEDKDNSEPAARVTQEDYRKTVGDYNSYAELKRAMKRAEKMGWKKNDDNVDLFKFCQKIHTGKLTQEKLEKLLFLAD